MNAVLGFDLATYDKSQGVSSIRLSQSTIPAALQVAQAQFNDGLALARRGLAKSVRADGAPLNDQEVGVVSAQRSSVACYDQWCRDIAIRADRGDYEAKVIKGALMNPDVRMDDYAGGNGFLLPLQNAFIVKPLLQEPLPEMTSFQLLKTRPVDAWKDYYVIGRRKHAGQAAFSNGGNTGIPVASSSANYETHPIFTIVTSYQGNLISQNKLSEAGYDKLMLDRESAVYALRQLMNYTNFSGNTALALPGIFNYPGQPQIVSTQVFNQAASADTMLGLLNTWMTTSYGVMSGIAAFRPNVIRLSPKLYALLAAAKNFTSYQTDGSTVLQLFIRNQRILNPNITIEMSPELASAGPSGQDGILFMNDSIDSAAYVNPMQIAELPPQWSGFTSTHIMFARYGGFAAPNCAANLVVWVPLS